MYPSDPQRLCCCLFFFFSSRRRHTRCSRDWSSDVCSSDLVYYASVDFGCSLLQPSSQFSAYIQSGSAFALCILGLSWAFRDQQRRCPVCLRRMAHPVEVGQPMRTFLAWNGTELICERGHTLLHIPAIPISWFGTQRWVCLDASWQFLLARRKGASSLS